MPSDGGALLLSETDRLYSVTGSLAASFVDHRNTRRIGHQIETPVAQRVIVLVQGYEDLVGRHDLAIYTPNPH